MTDAAYKAYMICTAPRSGSTLLCRLLAATGRAGAPDSHFHVPSLDRWATSHGVDLARFASERAALRAVVARAIARGRGATDLFGLRMQRRSFGFFLEQLGRLHPGLGRDVDRIEAAFGRTLFISLRRQDKVAQAVSRVIATQTGLWHRHADGRELERVSPQAPAVYDAAAIAEVIAEQEALDAGWAAWFAREGVTPLALTYEALSADPEAALTQVLVALGLDPSLAKGLPPPTAKLADATNAEWIARFRREMG